MKRSESEQEAQTVNGSGNAGRDECSGMEMMLMNWCEDVENSLDKENKKDVK